jgi:glycosyltransferase involved in cell wall biosynthesis
LKILQVTASYKPAFIYGGPTMSVSMLSEQLAKAGINVTVFTTTANGKQELKVEPGKSITVDGVEVTYFKRITKDQTHFSPALLKQLWRGAKNYDVIHVHGWWNTVSVLSGLVAKLQKVPFIISPRGMLSNYSFQNKNNAVKGLIHSAFGQSVLKNSFIHATSQNEYGAVQKIIKPKGIFNLPNFINFTGKVKKTNHIIRNELRLIFFSRIEQKKGLDILINALKDVTVPYALTIAGDGDPKYVAGLKSLAVQNGLESKISWIGFQTDKFELLAKFDLLVLPSYDENFGNVVIESLSVGTAVLISENVGLADYVKQNDLGWICSTDSISVAGAINELYNNRDKLKRINDKAPQKIADDFDDTNLVKRYIGMYTAVINTGRGPGSKGQAPGKTISI